MHKIYVLFLPLSTAGSDYYPVLIVNSWWFGITDEEWFDWKAYLLDGEEEEIIGLPNQQYQVQDIIINNFYSPASSSQLIVFLCSQDTTFSNSFNIS